MKYWKRPFGEKTFIRTVRGGRHGQTTLEVGKIVLYNEENS